MHVKAERRRGFSVLHSQGLYIAISELQTTRCLHKRSFANDEPSRFDFRLGLRETFEFVIPLTPAKETRDSVTYFTQITFVISRLRCSIFTRDSIYAIARICYGNSVCLSVRLSVTRVDQSKTFEARITQFSPYSSPIPLVFRG